MRLNRVDPTFGDGTSCIVDGSWKQTTLPGGLGEIIFPFCSQAFPVLQIMSM
jgi:hypothetical protein